MTTKLLLALAVGHLMLSSVVHATNHTAFLEDAMECLVDYTATESSNVLNSLGISNRVTKSARQQFEAKIAGEYPRHCNDHTSHNPPTRSGITIIKPDDGKPFRVYCDMDIYGGGWTRILRRGSDTMSFYRTWKSYKNGFGWLSGDGWLGLEKIHRLTNSQPSSELLIRLYARNGYYYFPQYRNFSIGSEATGYTLYIGGFTGTGGDHLTYSNLSKFSTYDRDNDNNSGNCASSYRGGWWYNSCARGKLTGEPYASSTSYNYVKWPGVDSYALYEATMQIKLSN